MRPGTRALGALLVLLALGAGAAPASAEDEVTIEHVETDRGTVSVLLSTDGLPAGTVVDPSDVSVELNGGAVETAAKLVDAATSSGPPFLVLDASNSMRGQDASPRPRGRSPPSSTALPTTWLSDSSPSPARSPPRCPPPSTTRRSDRPSTRSSSARAPTSSTRSWRRSRSSAPATERTASWSSPTVPTPTAP